jgi:Flp pilus assembly protein TadB
MRLFRRVLRVIKQKASTPQNNKHIQEKTMFRKTLLATLAFSIFCLGTNANVFAQARASENNRAISAEKSETKFEAASVQKSSNPDLKKALFEKKDSSAYKEKNNLAEYEKQKAQGKKFSTTTKILIGVGIAAAVIAIVVIAASQDKIETF